MQDLVSFLARGLTTYPEQIRINAVEGEATVMIELSVHPDDVPRIIGSGGRNIKAIRQVLSAASGRRRAVLELVDTDEARGTEE